MTPHLLFVDDDIPIRETLSLYFKKKGITVATAACGEEAIRLAEETAFNLAILDVNLGNEDGLDLLQTFRRLHSTLPVIMFTGMTEQTLWDLTTQFAALKIRVMVRSQRSAGALHGAQSLILVSVSHASVWTACGLPPLLELISSNAHLRASVVPPAAFGIALQQCLV